MRIGLVKLTLNVAYVIKYRNNEIFNSQYMSSSAIPQVPWKAVLRDYFETSKWNFPINVHLEASPGELELN